MTKMTGRMVFHHGPGTFSLSRIALALIIMVVLLLDLLPMVYGSQRDLSNSGSADYGIYDKMVDFQSQISTRMDNPSILNATQVPLSRMEPLNYDPPNPVAGFDVQQIVPSDPRIIRPHIFNELESNPMMNMTDIFEWILPQPMTSEGAANFWVYTRSDTDNSTHTAWEQGSLRRTLIYPRTSLTKWIPINTDDDLTTGSGGADVRIRINWVVESAQVRMPTLIPLHGPTLQLKGGIELEVERLRSDAIPLNITMLKSTSYNDNNYLWSITLAFRQLPSHFTSYIGVDKIQTGDLTMNVINSFLNGGNISMDDIASVKGPYRITYNSDDELDELGVTAGLIRLVDRELVDKTWSRAELFPVEGSGLIPRTGTIWVNAEDPNAPLDTLIWTAGSPDVPSSSRPVHLLFHYSEEADNLTYAMADIEDLPTSLNITFDYRTDDQGRNYTVLDYTASDRISVIDYDEFLFFREDGDYRISKFNYTHFRIQDLPTRFHMEVTTNVGRNTIVNRPQNPALGILDTLVDNVIRKVASRIYGIGVSIRAIPMSLLSLPANQGRTFITAYDEYFGDIRYVQTSGRYLDSDKNFFAFYTDKGIPVLEQNPRMPISLSGHLSFIKNLRSEMKGKTQVHIELEGGYSFYMISVNGNDHVNIEISNLPDIIDLDVKENDIEIVTGGGGEQQDARNHIRNLDLMVKKGTSFLKLDMSDLPTGISFRKSPNGTLEIGTDGGNIGVLEAYMADDYRHGIPYIPEGNAICMNQWNDSGSIFLRIQGLDSFRYNPSPSSGMMDLLLGTSAPLQLFMNNEVERMLVKMILNPIPNHLGLEMPGEVDPSVVRMPDLVNITGLMDYSSVMFSLSDISEGIIGVFGNVSSSLIKKLGGFGTDLAFSYDLLSYSSTMDVIVSFRKGNRSELGDVSWTHGASIWQGFDSDGEIILNGNLYLPGLPHSANISLSMSPEVMNVSLELDEYSPVYPWIVVETFGLQDQDTVIYLDGLEPNMNLSVQAYVYTDLSIGGEMGGSISTHAEYSGGEPLELKEFYIKIRKYSPIISIREVYLPMLPSDMDITFSVKSDVLVDYSSSSKVEYMYVKMTKYLNLHWSGITAILHDIPTRFHIEMNTDDSFSLLKPMPLQGMPEMDVVCNDDSFDAYLSYDGMGMGQRGNYEILLKDVNETHAHLINDHYILSGGGIGFLVVKITDLPIMAEYRINSLMILGQEIKGLDLSATMLFGIYPVFDVNHVRGTGLVISIDHQFTYMGKTFNIRASLVDIAYRNMAGHSLPAQTPIFVDTFSLDMQRNTRHILIPAPQSTLITTLIR